MTAESISVPDRKLRILVVEDEPLIAMMLAQMLNEFGCEYIGPIGNRKTALECARTEEMDAAILNLVIGGEKAYDVAEALAARGIPFGFASGVHRDGFAKEWFDRPYLEKPFTSADVWRLLSQVFAETSETILRKPRSGSTTPLQVPGQSN